MEFKTLTYLGKFVDTNFLEEGIYIKLVPQLYPIDTTIEYLV